MVKALLIRGMLAGALAGLAAFIVASVFGEPAIDYAIGFEERMQAAVHAAGDTHAHEAETVSRGVQATAGLLTALAVYGAGIGGLFAIAFAFAYGRMGALGARATAALLAAAGFLTVALVPFLKYPANPPAVGQADTLGSRTALFLLMIAIAIVAVLVAVEMVRRLAGRVGLWVAIALGGALFVTIVAVAQLLLPDVQEVPAQFSAGALWRFRAASLGMQFLMWAALGYVFGALSTRLLEPRRAAIAGK